MLLLFWVAFLSAQNPHPYFRNYTTDHGLPSPEVHYCLEDSLGFMWFATDNGLSRFDGYRFKNYGLQEGLKDPVILFMQLDSKGRIWMATLSGNLYFMENDSIHAFTGNAVMQLVGTEYYPDDFLIGKDDEMYLGFSGTGLLRFEPDGSHRLIQARGRYGGSFLYRTSSKWLRGSTACPDSLRNELSAKYAYLNLMPPLELHADTVALVKGDFVDSGMSTGGSWVMELSKNRLLFFIHSHLYEIEGDAVVSRRPIDYRPIRKSIVQWPDGSIFVGLQENGGLRRYRNLDAWETEDFEQLLPGKTISHIFEDSRGGLWVGTIEHGVFHCPDPGRKIFDRSAGLPMDYVAALAFGKEDELFFGLRNGQVFRLNLQTDGLIPLPKIPGQQIVYDLVFDEKEKTLWAANNRSAYLKNGRWENLPYNDPFSLRPWFVMGKKLTLRPGSHQLWGANNSRFVMIDIRKKELALDSKSLGLGNRAMVAFEASDGRIWVGRPDGLYEFRDSQLFQSEPFHPEFKTRVDDLAELPDATLVIATKGDGLLLWRDTFFQQLTTDDGLTSNMLENLHADAEGRIWAGSLLGLNRITFLSSVSTPSANTAQLTVENFTTWHGLPSNEITMVRSRGNDIWVATTRGLMQWLEPQKNHSIEPPFFEKIEVNGTSIPLASSTTWSHDENNFSFHYLSLNYEQAGRIPYRYRLNGHNWSHTEGRAVNFAKLAPGNYQFEVQSQNEDGVWSQSLVHEFTIHNPWWLQWWFYLLMVAGSMAAIWAFYQYRKGIFRKEVALQKQLTDMERQALAAQMNPHFIFNCLNSIRRLILDQDGDNALLYLTRFSKLVRGNLQASVEGLITLQEEIEILKNYLELEKLRFKDAFNYAIEINNSIDLFEVVLPPMLIQPYVENAVIYGMQATTGNGMIDISFSMEDNILIATVTDNGPGIFHTEKNKTSHKSIGMTLTKRRLELLDGGSSNELVKVTEILGNEGKVLGTKIEVRIRQLQ